MPDLTTRIDRAVTDGEAVDGPGQPPVAEDGRDRALDPAALAAHVTQAMATWLLRDRQPPRPHGHVWASSWRACERRMVYECVCPDQQTPFDASVIARFRRGDDRERDLLVDLQRIGRDADPAFAIVGQQERFELRSRHGQVVIAGKVDARLHVGRASMPMEVKAWSAQLVDRIETFDDVFDSPWTRSGGYQLLSYLYGANEPVGFLLLDRSGLPRLVPVALDDRNLERMEAFLSRAEAVVAHVQAGTLPDFFEDPSECPRCPFFGTACQPPLPATPTQVLTDPELEIALERWHELRPAGRDWNGLDADLKRRLRGVTSGIAGHFSIRGTWGKSSRVELPPELKKQYTVTDPRGKFTLEIEKL